MNSPKTIGSVLLVLLVCAAQAQDGEQAYRDARAAMGRQDLDAAIEGFEALRNDYPDSEYADDAYYWEAFALERRDELEAAVERIDMLLTRAPDSPDRAARALLSDARALRLRVCSELARRGDSECAAAVSTAVSDPDRLDEATRLAAITALVNMPADRAVRIAEQVVSNRDQPTAVRRQALFILAEKAGGAGAEDRVRETLRGIALDDGDVSEVREQAVFWLSRVPGAETLATLAELVNGSATTELKRRAVFAISQHGTPEAARMLRELALDSDVPVEVRKQAVFWTAQAVGPEAFEFLTRFYSDVDDPELKRQTLLAVSQLGSDEAGAWFVSIAEDGSESTEMRRQALFWGREVLSVDELMSLYDRFEGEELRGHVIWIISEHGGPDALDALAEVAQQDPDAEMRRRATFWIGNSGDPRAEQILLDLLEEPAP